MPLADFRAQIRACRATWKMLAMIDSRRSPSATMSSRTVVLRRMLDDERVSSDFYRDKAAERDAQREAGGAGGNFHATQNAYLSEKFAQEIFARYSRRQISLDEAADYFDIAPKNVEKLQDLVLRGAARMTYVFDTNSLSELNAYYPDIFKAFWNQFDAMVASGEVDFDARGSPGGRAQRQGQHRRVDQGTTAKSSPCRPLGRRRSSRRFSPFRISRR